MKKLPTVLILAGGDSDRFWPLKNKNYWQFLGKSGLEHQINFYSQITDKIVLVENESNQNIALKLVAKLKEELKCKIELVFQKQDLPGQGGAVLSAQDQLKGEVLIVNANDYYEEKILKDLVVQITEKNPDLFFLVKKTNEYFPGGYLKLEKNRLKAIIEKPALNNLPSDLVKLVVDYVRDSQKLVNLLKNTQTENDDRYELALNQYISQTENIQYLINDSEWFTLKYPWQILPLIQHFLSRLGTQVKIGKNVKISPTSKIVGPCFIGDNTVIGDFSLVVNSHIGANSLIGGYCEVTRSYLGDKVMLHRNYVGDSILADAVLMGAGAVTANFRFDQKPIGSLVKNNKINTNMIKLGAVIGNGTKIGVNSTLFPGVKIGSNKLVMPGSIVTKDNG